MKLLPLGPNQTLLQLGNSEVFFSYKTPVAACIQGTYYRTTQSWSKTTSRHIKSSLAGVKATGKPQEFFDNLVRDSG